MTQVFRSPPTVLTGDGCFDALGEYARGLGSRCLVVTGKRAMREQGILDRAAALLEKAGYTVAVFDGVEHDPSLETVDAGRAACLDAQGDTVLGLGGGSALDAAKAIAGLVNEAEPTKVFFDGKPLGGSGIPVLAAPSTFGTGSETTRVAVLSDPLETRKKSIRHDCMLPRVAVADPRLGMGAPPALTAACGLDALTQAIESYLSIHATDVTQALSFSATVLLADGLPRAFANGHDLAAREHCANGSLMAGLALSNARLGIVHGLAHPLGARYGLIHGEVCGILLPHALAFNRAAAEEKYALLSGILGGDAAEACRGMLERFGLPTDLAHVEIPEGDLPAIAEEALESGSTKANPRPVTKDDVIAFLQPLRAG